MMKLAAGLLAVMFSFPVSAKSPDCTDPEHWPAKLVENAVVDSGFASGGGLDYSKTKVVRLASEKMGRVPYSGKISTNLYRQVHRVTFFKKSGESIMAIVVSDASHYECSMASGGVYLISKFVGDTPEPK